ncbi:MAG TPA: GTP-binding protein EngB [archaeon]|jgi:GTP-binding protein EngB required for normal cell division
MKCIELFFVGRTNAGKSTVIKELFGLKTRTGKNPGVTKIPVRYELGDLIVTDLPGIGFRRGLISSQSILREITEKMRKRQQPPLAVQIIDAKSFLKIIERHSRPLDVDLFEYLLDLEIDPIVAINKMDKIEAHEANLNNIVSQLGMLPPYRQWIDRVAPISAKKHDVSELRWLINCRIQHLREINETSTA